VKECKDESFLEHVILLKNPKIPEYGYLEIYSSS
jgi:hypothetical protein